ncbi:aminotransferase class I/II-fold pyridoxal phosphate-dependent enzyme [Solirubrobacter sp. CPCC 204708]|uniref:cysteine-S-conjugate beta-lyase n=1 Tax=Solirubrobacter deserti TaxID=2282478 RepID=A0ABT4RTT2_9ACTN|nr:aminotransferase class I/II-fold pyridoxal phosphate-dependent enzyme [Solirubrobacter deserti]MBE2318700.1 aminotransferase class I/II-fold pyridoxal phosphate-dependent enzyme [Solirubrobacter deserti]MDA0141989.1 aminotransferase class I/II-fold pyridoxal phosphate-dependent enzyme [Solirubrobacter deserti]
MDDLLERGSDKWTKYPPDVLPAFVAEMDFELAPPVREALVRAIERGDLGYIGNVDGLIEAMYYFFDRRLGWDLEGQYIALVADVTVGLQELLRARTRPDDAVIINPPAYPPYYREIPHTGRRVVEVPLLADFGVDVDGLDRAFGAGAKALLLCSPHNPSGRVYTRDELAAVAAVAEAHGALVIVDEIHAPLTFGAQFVPWQHVVEGGAVLTSASKAFNVPGLKLGFVVGEAASALPEDLTDHAGYAGVIAAQAAFNEGDEWLDETLATIAANHRALPELLPDGVRVAYPAAASFLTWLECDIDHPADVFLERGRVALNPGRDFGAAYGRYARLNVGTRPELVREAVSRMASALS